METQQLTRASLGTRRPLAARLIGVAALLSGFALPGVAAAQATTDAGDAGSKTLIDYFQPTSIVCPLTSNAWEGPLGGAMGVLPRDKCNGLEDPNSTQTQSPMWFYWDGKVIPGPDGSYYMFASRWTWGISATG